MKITILGAGNMGCANAADLTLKGHEVTLVKTSHSMHNETFNYVCAHNNEITLTCPLSPRRTWSISPPRPTSTSS